MKSKNAKETFIQDEDEKKISLGHNSDLTERKKWFADPFISQKLHGKYFQRIVFPFNTPRNSTKEEM